jgi:Cu-Zn family superoxide dismutase
VAGVGLASAQTNAPVTASTDIVRADGERVGELTLTEGPAGVLIRISVSGLTPGWHAMHFHAVAECSDAGFQASGSHVNSAEHAAPHGLLNPDGPDFGDLPNIYAGPDGTAYAEAISNLVTLADAEHRAQLLDADGSALVIHASADDHISQPIGGAGDRVACAAIQPAS